MDDCLIVGAGVIGLSIGYELAQQGWRVRIVDSSEPGKEASWAGAGILPPANLDTAHDPYDQLRGLSHRLHPLWAARLREETGIDTGYRRCGGVYLARSGGEAAALVGYSELLRELGIVVERVALEELAQLEPALRPALESDRFRAAYLLPDEAQLRNPWHVRALVEGCRRRGVRIEASLALESVVLRGGRVDAIVTRAGELRADRFCFCAGPWTAALLHQVGVETGILPIRGQIVLLRSEGPRLQRVVNEGSRYLVPREDGRILAGSTEEEVGFNKSTTQEAIRDLTQFAYDLVPSLRGIAPEKIWAGLRPATYDGLPYLGAVPGLDNAFAAAGHFRAGLHLSTGTAVVMGELMRGQRPQFDLTPFRLGRG